MTRVDRAPRRGFDLLTTLTGDTEIANLLSENALVGSWLTVESVLAAAQADLGLIPAEAATAIAAAAHVDLIDLDKLWQESRNVGYPILPLVRQLDALLPEHHRGTVHLGATTQDIMDTGLSLQMVAASDRIADLLGRVGDHLADTADKYRGTVMVARTHAQHAVPTTWGAKLGGYLAEMARHRDRLARARDTVAHVSLFGAGGTAAGYGPRITDIRAGVAERLDLRSEAVPRHVARDGIAEWGVCLAAITATCARLAREVVDLSRTEIAEVTERAERHRGASSTMPQKANPITAESLIGLSAATGAVSASLFRAMESGHDRAAGEWLTEWQVLPLVAGNTAAALCGAEELVAGLQVFPERMRRNLELDHGLVMAEAYMMALAPAMGREQAHDLVYAAAVHVRDSGARLFESVRSHLPEDLHETLPAPLAPDSYLGDVDRVVSEAIAAWRPGAEVR